MAKGGKNKKAKRRIRYEHIIVIVHGYTEYCFAKHIKSVLNLPMDIYSRKKGGNSIKINDLEKIFSNRDFNEGFKSKFYKVEYKSNKPVNLQIFVIMDKDDTDKNVFDDYKTGRLFKEVNSKIKDLIIPIYNEVKIEDVLEEIDWNYSKRNEEKGKIYSEIFPVMSNKSNREKCTKKEEIEDLKQRLEDNPHTNMEIFIDACLNDK